MAKAPNRPEELFAEFTRDCNKIFSAELVSIILYGSGARGEYIPKKSDINFAVILTDEGINRLSMAIPFVASWKKRRVATPLFLTKEYIASSLDTFPIEFLNLKAAYTVVFGQDILRDLVFDRRLMRIQCEREIKGKLLQLRQSLLETEGNKRKIAALISLSLPTFFSIFQAILFLKGRAGISGKEQLLAAMTQVTALRSEVFCELTAIREGKKQVASSEAVPLMERYIEEIKKISAVVDTLDIT